MRLTEHLQRKQVKKLLDDLAAKNPYVSPQFARGLGQRSAHHLLDAKLSAALGLTRSVESEVSTHEDFVPAARCYAASLQALSVGSAASRRREFARVH